MRRMSRWIVVAAVAWIFSSLCFCMAWALFHQKREEIDFDKIEWDRYLMLLNQGYYDDER